MPLNFNEIAERLSVAGIESPELETRLILAALNNIEPAAVSRSHTMVPSGREKQAAQIISDRLQHKPLCKILGKKGFYKYDFIVNCDVLSPRPDTEILVEAAIDAVRLNGGKTLLDLGTGSGCILLSVLGDCPDLVGTGIDISGRALEVAAANAELLGLKNRTNFLNLDWFADDFAAVLSQKFDVIVSNPPYIPTAEIASLEKEVKDYDPGRALDGGTDGLECYRRLSVLIPQLLNPGGSLLLEVGESQAEEVSNLFVGAGLQLRDILKDYGGIKRCVILKN